MTNEKDSFKDAAIASHQNTKERDYWLTQLSGELSKSVFPYDFTTGTTPQELKTIRFSLGEPLFSQLIKLSKGIDYTLHMIVVAATTALLSRYSGNHDIIVGMPIYRQDSDQKFVNKVVALRSRLTEAITFKELLMQVRQTIIDADQNQNYAIETLLYQLNIPETGADFPLFDCAVLLENVHDKTYLEDIPLNTVFSFLRSDTDIIGELTYNPRRYRDETAQQIVLHLSRLLASFLQDMNAPVATVVFLSPQEKQCLLEEFNATTMDFPTAQTIVGLFEAQVARVPDGIALHGATDDTTAENALTYSQLNKEANRLAYWLRQKGGQPNTLIGIMSDRTINTMMAITGILKAGAAYLPIDPESPISRIVSILEDAGTTLLLTKTPLAGLPHSLEQLSIVDLTKTLAPFPGENPAPVNCSTDLAYSIFTSGSTGRPKGVLIEHGHVHHLVVGLKQRIYDRYRALAPLKVGLVSPFVFDASIKQIFAALLQGYCLCIIPEQVRTDVEQLFEYYRRRFIHVADGTPAHIGMLTEAMSESRSHPGVKHFLIGGEVLSQGVVENFFNHIPAGAPRPVLTNIYGPSECTVDTTAFDITDNTRYHRNDIPIGKPMPNSRVYIVDAHQNPVPLGVTGELCIGGSGVGRGYLNDPSLTHSKFQSHPTLLATTIYHTGDLARWLPDGNIVFAGRSDHQVKIRGFRIELEDIQAQLGRHPLIKETIVMTRQDQTGDKYLCAYIVWNMAATESNVSELRDYLSRELPEYMIPSRFIRLVALPLTANGKVDRRRLPSPESEAGKIYSPPRDSLEEKLVETWADLLGKEKEKLGIDDNFFEIGGHSLKATILISRMHKSFNVKIPLTDIFRGPSIRELAARIRKANTQDFNAIPLVEKKEYYPLTSAMTRLYFEQQLDPQSTAYNISSVAQLEGALDTHRFTTVFQLLLERHESLRTSFQLLAGQPVQKVHETAEVPFTVVYDQLDIHVTPIEKAIAPFFAPFDLAQPPLMRVGLFKTGATQHVFIVNINHIIADGTSIAILCREFMALYNKKTLPPLRVQYKDFSQWKHQQLLLEDQSLEKQEQFWLGQFSGELPVLNLPYDYPRPPRKSSAGAIYETVVGETETEQILALATQENVTLYILGLSLFNVLLMKLSGQEDIIVGSPNAGRLHTDLEPMIGMFVNTLPLRNHPGGQLTFKAFLKEVKERTLEAFANQDYAFETLVSRVLVRRDPSRTPLTDVFFAVQNMDRSPLESGGLRMVPYEHGHFNARFDLCFHVFEENAQLHFMIEYCTELFKLETVAMFIKNFNEIAALVVANRDILLRDIRISTEIKNIITTMPQVDLGF